MRGRPTYQFAPQFTPFVADVYIQNCGDVLTKKKLDGHRNQCRGASFTCLDCMVHFQGFDYKSHTSCISEAQKYQGHLYREKDNKKAKNDRRKSGNFDNNNSNAMTYKAAYVEDEDGGDSQAIAVIDVPPRAPTPPSASEYAPLPENINVFDFLVEEATPSGKERGSMENPRYRRIADSQNPNAHDSEYLANGFSYGDSAVKPGFDRYESYSQFEDSQQSSLMPPPTYVTPAPKHKERKEFRTTEKSDKKRKRGHVEDLDLSSTKRPVSRDEPMTDAPSVGSAGRVLHSGLTGGLSRLITDPEFYEDRIDAGPTPISPIKRSKREGDFEKATKDERRKSSYGGSQVSSRTSSTKMTDDRSRKRVSRRRDSFSSDDVERSSRKSQRAIEFSGDRPGSVQPSGSNQLVSYRSRAELFMSFVNKGPDSERGCSVNKALKRYHRERDVRNDEKEEEDKELFKTLRLRRNSRGEIVLFI